MTMLIIKIISIIITILCIYIMFKNENTYRNRCIIAYAISEYMYANKIVSGSMIKYSDMESYNKTLLRLWDWSYKRILPRRKYRLIEPYITTYDNVKKVLKNV